MKTLLLRALIPACLCLTGSVVSATNFSILLDSDTAGSQDDTASINNPLYSDDAKQADNPLYGSRVSSLNLNLNQIWRAAGEDAYLTVDTGDSLPRSDKDRPDQYTRNYGFKVELTAADDGTPITDLLAPIDFHFVIPSNNPSADGLPGSLRGGVLGFFNEDTQQWEVEDPQVDKCIEGEANQYCGTTNHLTLFALGQPTTLPEPTSLALLGLGGLVLMRRRSK